ncbi:unnamed protein product [Rhodiola kirilowii]
MKKRRNRRANLERITSEFEELKWKDKRKEKRRNQGSSFSRVIWFFWRRHHWWIAVVSLGSVNFGKTIWRRIEESLVKSSPSVTSFRSIQILDYVLHYDE